MAIGEMPASRPKAELVSWLLAIAVFIGGLPRFLNQAKQCGGRNPSTPFRVRSAAEQRETNSFENDDKDYCAVGRMRGVLI